MKIYFSTYDTGGYSQGTRGSFKIGTPIFMYAKGVRNFCYYFDPSSSNVSRDRWPLDMFLKIIEHPYENLFWPRNCKEGPNYSHSDSHVAKIVKRIANDCCQLTGKKFSYNGKGEPISHAAHLVPYGRIKKFEDLELIKIFDSCRFRVAMRSDVHEKFDRNESFFKDNLYRALEIGKNNYEIALKEGWIDPIPGRDLKIIDVMIGLYK